MALILDSMLHLTLLVGAIALLYKLSRLGRRGDFLPPGPPTIPILGNAHQIPTTGFNARIHEWAEQYGPVFSFILGKSICIVLNDRQAVHELIDQKGALFKDRVYDRQALETFHGLNYALMDATPMWRAQRKLTVKMMSEKNLDGPMREIRDAENASLMHDLLEDPDRFAAHIGRSLASAASIVVYGQRAKTLDDFWNTYTHAAHKAVTETLSPGSYIPTDQFPVLDLIPYSWNPATLKARKARETLDGIWQEARQRVDKRRAEGDKRDSILDNTLDGSLKSDITLSDDELNHMCGTFIEGSALTTSITIQTSILFLAKYPEYQDKAQQELDGVCGDSRVPVWEDFDSLPYINCIAKEAQRIRPV
ncbi:unnamed protein product [Periconia digitata]|uniref:Cytochrome P450 n=1 Tax=Periconia digitata TaxID=1303443 RepID=A0A9W4U5J9_9PLEO|nr:unnamed protein product [Periconia digitata]